MSDFARMSHFVSQVGCNNLHCWLSLRFGYFFFSVEEEVPEWEKELQQELQVSADCSQILTQRDLFKNCKSFFDTKY